ncbi:MAG: 50S ribosomal protein L11 methyltransferase [Pseudomonadales bacterium]|nr:50S ribosomal protein L11 methyltransferase [Pseudomonadales bacterium]
MTQSITHKIQANLSATITAGEIKPTQLPICPEISLFLLAEEYPRGRLEQEEIVAIMANPAYWAFCWASGQVLGRYILDHAEIFKNKNILDFGAGSGVISIAAKLAGANKVIACDIDPDALDACAANAYLNNVKIELLDDIHKLTERIDIIVAADVLYDRDNFSWIDQLPSLAAHIFIADSRLKSSKLPGYEIINRLTVTTVPDLDELREYNDVRVYQTKSQSLHSKPE